MTGQEHEQDTKTKHVITSFNLQCRSLVYGRRLSFLRIELALTGVRWPQTYAVVRAEAKAM